MMMMMIYIQKENTSIPNYKIISTKMFKIK